MSRTSPAFACPDTVLHSPASTCLFRNNLNLNLFNSIDKFIYSSFQFCQALSLCLHATLAPEAGQERNERALAMMKSAVEEWTGWELLSGDPGARREGGGEEEILSAVPEAITPRIDELFAALESHGHDKTNFHERESVKIDLLVSKETHDKTNCHERESGPAYTLTEQDSSPAYTSR